MNPITLHIGLDVHKDSITMAIVQPGPKGEIRLFGAITNDLQLLTKINLDCVLMNDRTVIRRPCRGATLSMGESGGRAGRRYASTGFPPANIPCPCGAKAPTPSVPTGASFPASLHPVCYAISASRFAKSRPDVSAGNGLPDIPTGFATFK